MSGRAEKLNQRSEKSGRGIHRERDAKVRQSKKNVEKMFHGWPELPPVIYAPREVANIETVDLERCVRSCYKSV